MFNAELSLGGFGGHAVVALHGELDLAGVPTVTSHMIAAVAACGPSIIVDLADLEFIDCCGLGALLRMMKWTRESGGDLLLAAPQRHVRQLLRLTGLHGVFSVYPSVKLAASDLRLTPSASPGAPRRPMPSRLSAQSSAQSWHAARSPGNAAIGSYRLNRLRPEK
jgi:anti-sigma B factor antagonist